MIIQEDDSTAKYQIKRFEPGQIWINDKHYETSVIVRPHQLVVPWPPNNLDELQASHFDSLFNPKVDIVLLGTGKHLIVPKMDILRKLYEQGIGVEFMDSAAACRTYTILASEQRNVAACILII